MMKSALALLVFLVTCHPAFADDKKQNDGQEQGDGKEHADEDSGIVWNLKGSKFDPPVVTVRHHRAFSFKITNTDVLPTGFNCKGLKVEKPAVIGGTIVVRVLNPSPGTYDCTDNPNSSVSKGQMVVK